MLLTVACSELMCRGEAIALIPLTRERRAPAKSLPGVSRKESRKAKREKHRQSTAELKRIVMAKNANRCELCQAPASDAHHVISGPLRRVRQSADTMLALCRLCHRLLHDNKLAMLHHAADYCRSVGMAEAAADLTRRLTKIESRSLLPAPERSAP